MRDATVTAQTYVHSTAESHSITMNASLPPMTKYRIHVRTSDVDGAGTSGKVRLLLSGELRTEQFQLDKSVNHLEPFARGCEDVFEVQLVSLGILRSATVMLLEAGGLGSSWHLQEIEVIDTISMQSYLFGCRQKIGSSNPKVKMFFDLDGLNWISLCLKKPKQKPYEAFQDCILYKIHVRTSDMKGAGTDANVFLNITGELNCVQSLELKYNGLRSDKFESGCDDMFDFYLPPLGNIVKIKIMHDNSGIGSAWHLKDVKIIDTIADKSFLFECNQWLSQNEGPATIEKPYDSESSFLISLILDHPIVEDLSTLYK
jgi:hypothetical protein